MNHANSDSISDDARRQDIGSALGPIPSGLFILTARHEDARTGMLSSWVQQVGFSPPMVSVAVAKGRPIMPLISASRRFGLCQISADDNVLLRKFAKGIDPNEDPFLGFELISETATGLPVPVHALAYLECNAISHLDVEGDHDLFIGSVIAGRCLDEGKPQVHIRKDGFKY